MSNSMQHTLHDPKKTKTYPQLCSVSNVFHSAHFVYVKFVYRCVSLAQNKNIPNILTVSSHRMFVFVCSFDLHLLSNALINVDYFNNHFSKRFWNEITMGETDCVCWAIYSEINCLRSLFLFICPVLFAIPMVLHCFNYGAWYVSTSTHTVYYSFVLFVILYVTSFTWLNLSIWRWWKTIRPSYRVCVCAFSHISKARVPKENAINAWLALLLYANYNVQFVGCTVCGIFDELDRMNYGKQTFYLYSSCSWGFKQATIDEHCTQLFWLLLSVLFCLPDLKWNYHHFRRIFRLIYFSK